MLKENIEDYQKVLGECDCVEENWSWIVHIRYVSNVQHDTKLLEIVFCNEVFAWVRTLE